MRERARPADVKLEGIGKVFGSFVAVDDVHLHVKQGEFVSLLGPSGCGKTTTLRMVAGFVVPTHGDVYIGGERMNDVPPYRRACGMVFQNYALFPHMSVFDNVAFGLKVRGIRGDEIRRRVGEAIELVQMGGYEKQFPKQLSGGQQQRIALARALVIEPGVLLLDEPLSNLDAKLRIQMREEIRELVRTLGITTIFVTHDQEESMTMADRICLMNAGRIEQVGSAEEVYESPQTLFVARFVGTVNLIDGEIVGDTGGGLLAVETKHGIRVLGRSRAQVPPGPGRVAIAIRPERLRVGREEPGTGTNSLAGRIVDKTYLGPLIRYRVATRGGLSLTAEQQNREAEHLRAGEEVFVSWDSRDALVLAA